MEPRKAPCAVNDITKAQPRVDSHNDLRQHVLAIEEAFRTDSFPNRFLTTLNGIEFVDAYRLNQFFNKDTRTFKPAMKELAYKLLTNKYDDYHSAPNQSTTRVGNVIVAGPGAAGAPSPQRMSPRTAAKKHTLVPLSSIAGWKGKSAQLLCAICSTRTTMVCIECSSSESVVPLCKHTHSYGDKLIVKQCIKIHARDPEEARHAFPRSSGKKRARPPTVQSWLTEHDSD